VNTALRAIALLICVLSIAACVTERTPARPSANRPAPKAVSTTDPGALPAGPIATPALTARTINARTLVGIRTIGTVPYDGMVLPIVSPDGQRLATQTGDPPAWPTLLAALGAPPSPRTRVEVYDITVSPPKAIRPRAQLPGGLLLGRGADARGFLVEAPQPDGSRRIGRVSWADATLEWLTDAAAVHAFASLDAHGRVMCSRRAPDEPQFRIAIGGTPLDLNPGASTLLPTFDPAAGVYAMFAEGPMGLEIQIRSASVAPSGTPTDDALQLLARRTLADDGGAPTAYQAAEPMRGAAVTPPAAGSAPGVLLFHPGARRMVILDPASAELVPLARDSIAGCWSPDAAGWGVLLTTPDGLVFQRLQRDPYSNLWSTLPVARMLGEAWVPRATLDADAPFILIGPDKRRPNRLTIAAMSIVDDEDSLTRGR